MTDKIIIDVRVEVTPKLVSDLMVTVIEGGSNYWCEGIYLKEPTDQDHTIWYAVEQLYLNPLVLQVEPEDDEPKLINRQDLIKGFNLLATQYPDRMASILKEEYDADDADVWFQLAVFGEVVYG